MLEENYGVLLYVYQWRLFTNTPNHDKIFALIEASVIPKKGSTRKRYYFQYSISFRLFCVSTKKGTKCDCWK